MICFKVILSPRNASANILEHEYSNDVKSINEWIMDKVYVFHKGVR